MKPHGNSPRLAAMLLLLLVLLTGCATQPAPPLVVAPPEIPPLPAAARQIGSPTYSLRWSKKVETWRLHLTPPSSPATPASSSSTN